MPRGRRAAVLSPEEGEDRSLIEAAEKVFGDEINTAGGHEHWDGLEPIDIPDTIKRDEEDERFMEAILSLSDEKPDFGRPSLEDMITVRGGGLYLPVRRRVIWMRGEPRPHPDWTIDTVAEKVNEGKFTRGASGSGRDDKVEGGYARYRANVFDETGRLIATGTKTEFSERFLDFAEKAETGAIGRALAVAGYGTEAAVDLDEGLEQERIADAPVTRPINITNSSISGVRVGGRSENITEPQKREIARLSRSLKLGIGLAPMVKEMFGYETPDGDDANAALLDTLSRLTFEQASTLISKLNQALSAKQKGD